MRSAQLAPAMAQRPPKRRKVGQTNPLSQLVHLGGCSLRGLALIANEVAKLVLEGKLELQADGTIPGATRQSLTHGQRDVIRRCLRHLVCPRKGGGTVQVPYLAIQRLIPLLLEVSPEYSDIVAEALRSHPCTPSQPWDIIINFDEFAPGNKLKYVNYRKATVLNLNFLQLTQIDECWLAPLVVPKLILNRVDGGFSTVFTEFLKTVIRGVENLQEAGIAIQIGGVFHVIYGALRVVVADGDGLRDASNWKGASGLKLCWRHTKVLQRRSRSIAAAKRAGYVDHLCHSAEQCGPCSSVSTMRRHMSAVCAARRKYEAKTRGAKAEFDTLARNLGWSANPHGLLMQCPEGMDALTFDWVHTLLQDGVFPTEAALLLNKCAASGAFTIEEVEGALSDPAWQFCGADRKRLRKVGGIFLRGGDDKLKVTNSEALSLYGLLRVVVCDKLTGCTGLQKEFDAFQHLCVILDMILLVKHHMLSGKEASEIGIRSWEIWMRLRNECYGTDAGKPKWHWTLDVLQQLARFNFVADGFATERLHLRVKAIANNFSDMRTFGTHVPAHVVIRQMNMLARLRTGGKPHDGALSDGLAGRVSKTQLPDGSMELVGKFVSVGGTPPLDQLACERWIRWFVIGFRTGFLFVMGSDARARGTRYGTCYHHAFQYTV